MAIIHDGKIKELELKALEVRELIITMLTEAKSGHSAGALGMADIFTALYFHLMHHDPKNPEWEDRDRLILSNGHICPVRYAAMALAGYFPIEELKTLRKFGTRLQGHPERSRLPGVETTSGPLGSGLGQAAGMAYAGRMDGKKWHVYCAMSDAEQVAGVLYEAMIFAGANKLANLIGIIDRNNIQIDGFTEDIMPLEPLKEKYEACKWRVIEVGGHNMEQFINAVEEAKTSHEKPTVIIAHTIPGRGVSFMENKFEWHGIPPKPDEAQKALQELQVIKEKIISSK